MECLRGFISPSTLPVSRRLPPSGAAIKVPFCRFRAKLSNKDDLLLQSAIDSAIIRFKETHRPEPLFVDPYVGCLVPTNTQLDTRPHTHPYCLATKWVDDKLLSVTRTLDGPKQVVLLTDGMDTRPYRLSWPSSTLIFELSPERIYKETSLKLKDIGAKVPRNCFLLHIPLKSSNIQEDLYRSGFNGNRSSIWVLQGLPLRTIAGFEELLFDVGSLAMKGSMFFGELPSWLATTELGIKFCRTWMNKLFLSHGFHVDVIEYEDVARSLNRDPPVEDSENILFISEHMRFSDAQMEIWRNEVQRVEDDGDEEGFEDM